MHVCALLGWNFTLSSPEGYDLNPHAVEIAQNIIEKTKSSLHFIRDPRQAVKDAHVIYTDT